MEVNQIRNQKLEMQNLYGVKYFENGSQAIVTASATDLYYYKTFIGTHEIEVEQGDCLYWFDLESRTAHIHTGPIKVHSKYIGTIIRGYMPGNKSSEVSLSTTLPYVNGCSTRQVFSPDRLGDPTLQLLAIPPNSSEQAHHIHSTVRVVYVLSGEGTSVVGMDQYVIEEPLAPGKVVVLNKMCPHHFVTGNQPLYVLPLHIFSSVSGMETNHPMYNGTYIT